MRILVVFIACLSCLGLAGAWKWRSLFDDGDSDSVVTVAADSRGIYPLFRTVRTYIVRVPPPREYQTIYGPPVGTVYTRLRPPFGSPLPPPLPPPPPVRSPPPASHYGPPPPNINTIDTAAAVASAVARTILEVHGLGKNFVPVDVRTSKAAHAYHGREYSLGSQGSQGYSQGYSQGLSQGFSQRSSQGVAQGAPQGASTWGH